MIVFAVRRVWVARAPVDMRKSFDTLSALVRGQLGMDPLNGDAYIFIGKRRDRAKILLWHGAGFWLCHRRPARGRFRLPFRPAGVGSPEVVPWDQHDIVRIFEGK
jgi:transposase